MSTCCLASSGLCHSRVTPGFLVPEVRRALNESPVNVATLVRVISRRLKNLLLDHTFPSPPASALALPKFTSWSSANGGYGDRNTSKEVLNCLRVLGRVLPVIFELPDDSFEEELFWKRDTPPPASPDVRPSSANGNEEPQFVIEEEDDDEDTTPTASRTSKLPAQSETLGKAPDPPKMLPSLAEDLFNYTIDLLFCCGFTLPTSIQVDHHKINYVIW